MAKHSSVPRPLRASEFELRFASASAAKGWRDLTATQRGAMVDTWEFLTRTPTERTPTNYPLKGQLGTVHRQGQAFQRWQHKPTLKGSARIWFFVDGRTVLLEQVRTSHPSQTV